MACGSSNPYWRGDAMRPRALSAQYRDDFGSACSCGCGGSCGCGSKPVPPAVHVDCGCGCNGAPGGCGGGARTAGDITPPGRPCPGGWARLPDGSCPGDTPTGGGGGWQGNGPTTGPCPGGWARRPDGTCPGDAPSGGASGDLPAGWQSWTAEQRAAYAREAVARAGATPAEQQAAAERARAADNAMVVGIVTQGVAAIRQWLQTSSAERIAEIEAQARVQIAEIQARNGSQAALLELAQLRAELERLRGGGGYHGAPASAPSGGGAVETLGIGFLVAKLLGLF